MDSNKVAKEEEVFSEMDRLQMMCSFDNQPVESLSSDSKNICEMDKFNVMQAPLSSSSVRNNSTSSIQQTVGNSLLDDGGTAKQLSKAVGLTRLDSFDEEEVYNEFIEDNKRSDPEEYIDDVDYDTEGEEEERNWDVESLSDEFTLLQDSDIGENNDSSLPLRPTNASKSKNISSKPNSNFGRKNGIYTTPLMSFKVFIYLFLFRYF